MEITDLKLNERNKIEVSDALKAPLLRMKVEVDAETRVPETNDLIVYVNEYRNRNDRGEIVSYETEEIKYKLDYNDGEWHIFNKIFIPKKEYSSLTMKILSKNELNNLYVTNFMLIEDGIKNNYDYDENGNLIKTTNTDNNSNELKYDTNNQLISMFNPKGNNFKYEYDREVPNRIKKGISPTGISNEIKYDNNGNPYKTIIQNINPNDTLEENKKYEIRLGGTDKFLSCNFKTNLVSLLESTCNHQYFTLIKEGDYYKFKIGYKYLTFMFNNIFLSTNETDETLFKLERKDNGGYTIIPKLNEERCLTCIDNKLTTIEKTDNNEFFFEDIDTPLYIENKSYYTEDGRFITCVEDTLGRKIHYDIDETTGLTKSVTDQDIS